MTSQHTIPTLSNIQSNNESIERKMHKAISSAISTYNDWVDWVELQFNSGHIDESYLMDLVISTYKQGTHISPIEQAVDSLYLADPKWVSLMENTELKMPTQWVHQAAKQLTMNKLCSTDFPPVCHTEFAHEQKSALTI